MARKPLISAAMLELMAGRTHHAWTLEDLEAGLAQLGPAPSFSSVFRAAEKLVADGLVVRVPLDDGRARFELAGAHHDHLHCTACDELVPVPCVLAGAEASAIEAQTGVAIARHHVIFSGLCPACSARAGAR